MIRFAALVLALGTTTSAFGQGYLVDGPKPVVYAPLPTTATKLMVLSFSGATVVLPFTFSFFGQPVTSVGVSIYGYLTIADGSAGESTNTEIPQVVIGSVPPTFIAPWWDELAEGGTYRYLLSGVAPLRNIAFEWSTSKGTFQVQLFESTGQIRFVYGPTPPLNSNSASVGIQRQAGIGVVGATCTPACAGVDWVSLANRSIDFYKPGDLRVSRTSVDDTGYAGVSYRASATVRNAGGHASSNVTVRFYLSGDAVFSPATDAPLGDAVIASLDALTEQTVTSSALTVPVGTVAGSYFVFAEADPANAIVETDESNNVGLPAAMTVGAPRGDLLVAAFVPPGAARPGEMLSLSRSLRNAGNAAVGSFSYSWFLSDNAAVSVSDRALGVGTVTSLAAQQNDTATDVVPLPADAKPGQYWLGLCVNYDAASSSAGFGVPEISYLNNCFTPVQVTVVSTGAVAVLTTTLESANQFGTYGAQLEATGGDGAYTWALSAGVLPAGLQLSSEGSLAGIAASPGSFAFDVTVTSAGATATQHLTLVVANGTLPIAIVDQVLPSAQFGRPYRASLVAVGGRAPYAWSVESAPAGLALASNGALEGRAADSAGSHVLAVTVRDSAGNSATRALMIQVVNPSSLSIATNALPTAVLNRDFVQELSAVGGKAPYQWSLVRFQQLPENPTQVRGPVLAGFPPKFGLSIENGGGAGSFLRGTPGLAGLYSMTFNVTDTGGTTDSVTLLFLVTYAEALAITTSVLPDAFVNQPYLVKLSHSGDRLAVVTFSTACIEQATRPDEPQTCAPVDANQKLPEGLTLADDGTISGRPMSTTGSYAFLVKVSDAAGREDTRGLSIRLQPDFSKAPSGCTVADGSGWLAAAALLLSLRRRR